jgi:hypothetical protein
MKKYEHETKNKILLLIFLVLVIGMIFNACAHSSDAAFFSAKGMNYGHNVPNTVKLSDYKVIQVNVTSYVKKSHKFCCKLQDKITAMLVKKQLFEKVLNGKESQEPTADLQLDAEILALDKVTALDRMFFDDFVGKAKVVVINRLKDLKTGKELGTFTTGGQSSSGDLARAFAAGTTKQALKYTAKRIVRFIQTHM